LSQVPKFGSAALLAPSIVPLLFIALVGISSEKLEGLNVVAVFWITVVSYAGFFVFGYPLAKLLDKRGVLSIGTLLVSGLICGAIVGVLLGLVIGNFLGSYKAPTLRLLFTFGGLGGLVAFAFGLLANVRWSRGPFQGG
jgi:hypothetical protein